MKNQDKPSILYIHMIVLTHKSNIILQVPFNTDNLYQDYYIFKPCSGFIFTTVKSSSPDIFSDPVTIDTITTIIKLEEVAQHQLNIFKQQE